MTFLPQDENFMKEFSDQSEIEFQTDPRSLQRILLNREISPKSLRFPSSLTPVCKNKTAQRGHFDKHHEFFTSKNGTVYSRPRHLGLGSSGKKWPFAFGNGACQGAMPIRPTVKERSTEKYRFQSEKKARMNPREEFRESFSERKRTPAPFPIRSKAKKGLDFSKSAFDVEKSNSVDLTGDSFKFVKPLEILTSHIKGRATKPSLVELIMARESLAGFPRESFSALLRQSLSKAELDRMFEDDSTGSFEKLEMRLKTPKRPLPSKSFAETKIPERFVTETIENDGQISTSEEKEGVVEEPNKPETDNVLLQGENSIDEDCKEKCAHDDIPNFIIYEYLFDDPNMSLNDIGALERTCSFQDLRISNDIQDELTEITKTDLPRSQSALDLTKEDVEQKSELLIEDHLDELEKIRAEQARIENQLQNLMLESLKRKEQFKQIWGVSPKSINQKRQFKTVLSAHNVIFSPGSEEFSESDLKENEEEEDIFGMGTPLGGKKDCLSSPQLDVSISAELFDQFIDANSLKEKKPLKQGFSEVTDSILQSGDDVKLSDADSASEPLRKDSRVDLLHAEDMDIESDKENLNEPEDLKSLIAAAVRFHQEEKLKNVKTVRFVTPQKIHEFSVDEVQLDESSSSNTSISLNLLARQDDTSTLNESGLAPLTGLVHTPIPKNRKFKMSYEESDEDEESLDPKLRYLPTPVAMRDISNRAQQALASLYSDIPDESALANLKPFSSKKLFSEDCLHIDD